MDSPSFWIEGNRRRNQVGKFDMYYRCRLEWKRTSQRLLSSLASSWERSSSLLMLLLAVVHLLEHFKSLDMPTGRICTTRLVVCPYPMPYGVVYWLIELNHAEFPTFSDRASQGPGALMANRVSIILEACSGTQVPWENNILLKLLPGDVAFWNLSATLWYSNAFLVSTLQVRAKGVPGVLDER